MKGLNAEMQLQLKSLEKFSGTNVDDVIKEAVRLELAGVKSRSSGACNVNVVEEASGSNVTEGLLEPILARLDRLETMSSSRDDNTVNHIRSDSRNDSRGKQKVPFKGKLKKCRRCDSTQHVIRWCPSRLCQACGVEGHDSWDRKCAKYS